MDVMCGVVYRVGQWWEHQAIATEYKGHEHLNSTDKRHQRRKRVWESMLPYFRKLTSLGKGN